MEADGKPTKQYFTVNQLSNYLAGRSPGAIRNLVLRRAIPFRKPSGRLLFDRDEIDRWIKSSAGVSLEELRKEQMLMPFGKYRGWAVEEIETQYLIWLSTHIELRGPLRVAVSEALAGHAETHPVSTESDIKKIYRQLSLKYHPDRGGNTIAQQAINEFYSSLMEISYGRSQPRTQSRPPEKWFDR